MILSRLMSVVLVLTLLFAAPVRAGISLLRDADIEYGLKQLAAPILTAAGLSSSQVRLLVVNDSSLNAFVVDTRHIFIHSGLIMKLDSAAALQAVIAHEAAHIANGHITRRLGNLRTARTAAGLGMLLAAAAGAASSEGRAAAAIALGSQNSAKRIFLAHTRAEESSADIASVRYLKRAGIDPKGAVEVQELFRGQEALSTSRQDPYVRSHPLSRDRLRALKGLVAANPGGKRDPNAEYWFARMRGKLTAFKRAPSWTLRRAGSSASKDIALMRQAVAHHRSPNAKKAIRDINAALALRPNDPYLMELKGQILLESRNFDQAVAVYRNAANRAPREPLITGGLGRALLAANRPKEALKALETARGRDFFNAGLLRDLSVAYAKTGQPALASLATAERFALRGRWKDAELHAKRAADRLPRGSSPWQRAQDVLHAAKQSQRKRR
ncbi:M48 family metalloprotease [Tropicibacter sp. R15_0]|uniref:M48 family metalloprotease n=1 Tax=Tropicibacter sp. R15_0 TaxID=2821101 RepID=UPI00256FD173|nr:M48 family metalloprotease [Tropicibacter sp. R15_0]